MKPVYRLLKLALLFSVYFQVASCSDRVPEGFIHLNSVGYAPEAAKVATVTAEAITFEVVDIETNTVAFQGSLIPTQETEDHSGLLLLADFSDLQTEGSYHIVIDSGLSSHPFEIRKDPYRDAFKLVTRAMYLWRCGIAVHAEHNGYIYSQDACHLEDAYMDFIGQPGVIRNSTGGWHDAGDYNKYVTNGGAAVGPMLRAWEDFGPALTSVHLDIPESGGPIPDYLAEIKWKLDWLFTMQEEDGRVYHKISTQDFGGFIMPHDEHTPRYFVPWGTTATADFVAMMAGAARIFKAYDPEYAQQCLEAALKSYAFLQGHPEYHPADQSEFRTGRYESNDADDRLWAAAEVWATTGAAEALEDVEQRIRDRGYGFDEQFDWADLGNLGLYTYLFAEQNGRDPELESFLKHNLLETAAAIAELSNQHPFGRTLDLYYWGCNGTVARQSMTLHAAWKIDPRPEFQIAIENGIHHLFGRNAHSRSYVTGLGAEPPMHPHCRRSGADGVEASWPGYLVGGPHPGPQDWFDKQEDYRTNEIAINWNGALIYALASRL